MKTKIEALFMPNPKDEHGPTDAPESQFWFGYNTAIEDVLTILDSDPTDPGFSPDVLREHVRHLERRVQQLSAIAEVESRFMAEHGHRLAQLLNIEGFDIADRDAQITRALKDEPHSAACLAPGGVDDDICICGAHKRNQARRAQVYVAAGRCRYCNTLTNRTDSRGFNCCQNRRYD